MGSETLSNRQARVALVRSCAFIGACAHGTRARPWPTSQCARERLVRVRVHGLDQFFGCFVLLSTCMLPSLLPLIHAHPISIL
ncbi:uncharacterized protein DS421_2g49690 [Arachis hypogaea]|nr:uncharacterized protein DS421_2g49690 [Arachis hypogaea]